ncbi:MAG: carboxymuconolactone decarboxylase family protein, partial [Ilumatobacteraceae bacterium]
LTTAARWRSEYEWWAHARMAREHGVDDAVIDAIGRGQEPPFNLDDERVVHAVAQQLGRTGRIDSDIYQRAVEALRDRGVVELVSLCGYYALVSFTLNAFEVELPSGVPLTWER